MCVLEIDDFRIFIFVANAQELCTLLCAAGITKINHQREIKQIAIFLLFQDCDQMLSFFLLDAD